MNAPKATPTLNPFQDAEPQPPSLWGPIIIAIILGIATSAGVLLWRLPKLQEEAVPAAVQKTKISSQSKDWDFYSAEIDNLVKELRTERENYDKKNKDLAAVEMRIETEKKELLRIRAEIERMREDLSRITTELQNSEKTNIRSLARTYSNMKPSEAVAILAEMSDTNIVKMLALMKADVVARILGEMAKTNDGSGNATMAARAARLSDQLRLLKQEQAPQ
jgi:flagellar motility protein MotE (MotC chaperone)